MSVSGDVACWNNLVGSLLKDCGAVGNGLYVTADGKVEKRTEPAAGSVGVAFAAEAGVDGQAILARPHLWLV